MTSTRPERPKATTTTLTGEAASAMLRANSTKPEKKIAIVGFTASKTLAGWEDPSVEKWLCNNLWMHVESNDWTRLYDLHEDPDIVQDRQHDAFLRGQLQKRANGTDVTLGNRAVYVYAPKPDWPTAVKFPRDEVVAEFGGYQTNSISLMIGHALLEGVTHLAIFGVDMATGGEYAAQRPSCEWMLGIAQGMGVEVEIPESSDLLKSSGVYGTGADSALHAKMIERRDELKQRIEQVNGQMAQLQAQGAQLQGAQETTMYVLDVWCHPRATSRHEQPASDNGKVAGEIELAKVEA